jgi:hypothetical protein
MPQSTDPAIAGVNPLSGESSPACAAVDICLPLNHARCGGPNRFVSLSSQILISLMAGQQVDQRHQRGRVALRHRLLPSQQAVERRPPVRVNRLSSREPRLLLQ